MRKLRGAGRTTAVVVALVALVAMTTACQNWSQYLGNPGLTGEAPGETTITPANVSTLTAGVLGAAARREQHRRHRGDRERRQASTPPTDHVLVVADAFGKDGCSGSPVVCQPRWTADLPDGGAIGYASQPLVVGQHASSSARRGTGSAGVSSRSTRAASRTAVACPKTCQPLWTAAAGTDTGPNVVGGVAVRHRHDHPPTRGVRRRRARRTAAALRRSASRSGPLPSWSAVGARRSRTARSTSSTYYGTPGRWTVSTPPGRPAARAAPRSARRSSRSRCPGSSYGSVAVAGSIAYVQTTSGDARRLPTPPASTCTGVPAVCAPALDARPRPGAARPRRRRPSPADGSTSRHSHSSTGSVLWAFDAAGRRQGARRPRTSALRCGTRGRSVRRSTASRARSSRTVSCSCGRPGLGPDRAPRRATRRISCTAGMDRAAAGRRTTTTVAYATAYTRSDIQARRPYHRGLTACPAQV